MEDQVAEVVDQVVDRVEHKVDRVEADKKQPAMLSECIRSLPHLLLHYCFNRFRNCEKGKVYLALKLVVCRVSVTCRQDSRLNHLRSS